MVKKVFKHELIDDGEEVIEDTQTLIDPMMDDVSPNIQAHILKILQP